MTLGDKARQAVDTAKEGAKGAADNLKQVVGAAEAGPSPSGAGAPGYVQNAEHDEASGDVADPTDPADPADPADQGTAAGRGDTGRG